MPETCRFCTQLRKDISDSRYYTEQARKNGRSYVDNCTEKYVGAYCHKTYYQGEPCGRHTVYFDELNFCPLCASDLRPLLNGEIELD